LNRMEWNCVTRHFLLSLRPLIIEHACMLRHHMAHTQYKQVALPRRSRTYQPVLVIDYRIHPSTKATVLSFIGKKSKHLSGVTNSAKNLVFSSIILAQAQEFRLFRFKTFSCGAHVRRLQVRLLQEPNLTIRF
jgi:hypothetical protein